MLFFNLRAWCKTNLFIFIIYLKGDKIVLYAKRILKNVLGKPGKVHYLQQFSKVV